MTITKYYLVICISFKGLFIDGRFLGHHHIVKELINKAFASLFKIWATYRDNG